MSTTVAIGAMHLGVSPVVVIGVGLLGIVLVIGLLTLLANPRTRGTVVGLLLVLGFLAVTGWFVRVRTSEERLRQDAAWQATEAQLRPQPVPSQPAGDENVTVVLSPPDKLSTGKSGDDRVSVKIETHQQTGKGTMIYVKDNRVLEALRKNLLDKDRLADIGRHVVLDAIGMNLLDTIRRSTDKETEPAKLATPAAAPPAPGQDAVPAKSAAASSPKTPRAPAGKARTAPPPRAKSPSASAKAAPPGSSAYEETEPAFGKTQAECDANLDDELEKAFSRYVQRRQGTEDAGEVQLPADELRKFIVRSSQDQVESGTLGPILRATAVVDFERAYQTFRLSHKLWYLGGGLGAVLLLLSLAYGYLKIDLATGGAYRWRLRLAVATILVGMAAAITAFLA